MKFSSWADRINNEVGIINLMKDLGNAPTISGDRPLYMLGGGNPAHIPKIKEYFHGQMERILQTPDEFERLVGDYAGPQGSARFVAALADLLKANFGWNIGPENIAISNGSQMAFTVIFRLLSGKYPDGEPRQVLLPMTPEYIGYNEADEAESRFRSIRPNIVKTSQQTFKYEIDFANIEISDEVSAICISRPTNPTGNVVTDDEVTQLMALADKHEIPLIVDGAYGLPFPSIVFCDATVQWNENVVLVLSLSKLGLPGTRTGIIIAKPELIELFTCANAIMTLASGNFGSFLALQCVEDGKILELSRKIIRPFYRNALNDTVSSIRAYFAGLPYMLHEPEGAFFVWLWFPGLPISDDELYVRLKRRDVYVVPGNFFFPGLEGEWAHRHECIRISYAGRRDVVDRGLRIIAEEVRLAYRESG
ncbi:MAG: valine--pyruvate transaminase [Acidiferrobacterales bacterium]|nr:valine--pyruvate transaminase [Acidiferrobacterales bacterium]